MQHVDLLLWHVQFNQLYGLLSTHCENEPQHKASNPYTDIICSVNDLSTLHTILIITQPTDTVVWDWEIGESESMRK